jgi:hypothetical protein
VTACRTPRLQPWPGNKSTGTPAPVAGTPPKAPASIKIASTGQPTPPPNFDVLARDDAELGLRHESRHHGCRHRATPRGRAHSAVRTRNAGLISRTMRAKAGPCRPALMRASESEAVRAVRAWGISEISVRVLEEDDWHAYRDVRLAALRESPKAFLATYAEEAKRPERYRRDCMAQAHRLLAVRDGVPVGVASIGDAQGEHHDKQDNRNADQHVVVAGPGDHQGEQ